MPDFGGNTEPGADIFRECPECGNDEIYSQRDGFWSANRYLCNHCGYESKRNEVVKSFKELVKENREKGRDKTSFRDKNVKPQEKGLGKISNLELRRQVEDRQAEGWEIEEVTDSGERVVMFTTKGGTIGGHALTGVLTGIATLGLGNVAYQKLSERKNKVRIVLRAHDDSNYPAQNIDAENPIELIRELKQLNEEGLITDAEFEEKKQKLLDEM